MKVSQSGPKATGSSIGSTSTNATDKIDSTKSARTGKSSAAEALSTSVGSSAKVDVSSRAQELKRATELATPGGVDEAKVARLQALIDSGKYKVDAGAVAERLIDEQMKMNE